MNAMLLTIFTCVGLGLLATRFGERVHQLVIAVAIALTAVYWLLPRYM
jgi:hypothetical protein